MTASTTTVEERLAAYRADLDRAIDGYRPGEPSVLHTVRPMGRDRRGGPSPGRAIALVGTAAVVLAGLTIVVVNRSGESPVGPAAPLDSAATTMTTGSGSGSGEVSVTEPNDGTVPPATRVGQGSPCPQLDAGVAPATLYLGGPPSDANLAAAGFIFSQPAGADPRDVATGMLGLPIVGSDCGITASAAADGTVAVHVPASMYAAAMDLTVTVTSTSTAVGVTEIRGETQFDATRTGSTAELRLLDGIPESAVTMSVRFRKGEGMWELTTPVGGQAIALTVPVTETDRSSDAPVEWVLFTLFDAAGKIVGVGGVLVS